MKNELMRIEIAKFAGFKWFRYTRYESHFALLKTAPNDWWIEEAPPEGDEYKKLYHNPIDSVPNYPESLDAMHEAEKMLTKEQTKVWVKHIEKLVSSNPIKNTNSWTFACAHATAPQRAEALLRTIGKWQDSAMEGE